MKIEDIFLICLGSDEKLGGYLRQDIDLVDFVRREHPNIMFLATTFSALILGGKKKELFEEMTLIKVLEILQNQRPDLFKHFHTKKSLIWLDREIESFKNHFLR